jgi:hypothetical protein
MGKTSAPDEISVTRLRRLTAEDWAGILAGEPREVARWVEAAARHGFKAAQVIWGQMLLDGRGVERDLSAAFYCFGRAAALGSPDGINMVGRCHELGWGVAVDHPEAARHYLQAAVKGSDWGAYNLACMLLYGDGIAHDRAGALRWFLRSAAAGNAKAMGMIGRFHEEGWNVPADRDAASSWYRKAAEARDCWGAYNLARLLPPEQAQEALDLLRQALSTGTPNFLRTAGQELLDHTDDAFRNLGLAALHSRCEQGSSDDRFLYGRVLASRGGETRRAEAIFWLRRAATEGHGGATRLLAQLGEQLPARIHWPARLARRLERLAKSSDFSLTPRIS